MAIRVLVADKLEPSAVDALRRLGVQVDLRADATTETLPDLVADARVLIVRSTKVSAAAIAKAKNLSLIVRAGSGVNNIDVEAASARGIYVSNCPGKNAEAVAELCLGLILALDRRLVENVVDLQRGVWNKGEYSKASGLKGRTLGVVGYGAIGREVARRAMAFGMEVLAYSRKLTTEEAETDGVMRAISLDQVFSDSDVVTLHLPLSADTKAVVGRPLLFSMKPGALFINTSRAEVVDQAALVEAVKAGRIRVGTDVFAAEPETKSGTFSDALGRLPGVYGTHHIGASTDQAQQEVANAAVDIVATFLETGEVKHAVNILYAPPVQGTLVVRHLDEVGVLAAVLTKLKGGEINVQTMDNIIFAGGVAACARIRVADRPSPALIDEIRSLDHIISVELV